MPDLLEKCNAVTVKVPVFMAFLAVVENKFLLVKLS